MRNHIQIRRVAVEKGEMQIEDPCLEVHGTMHMLCTAESPHQQMAERSK
jgi:hypothetical protein